MLLQRQNVYDHFNPVVLSCKVGLRKPDPQMYEKASELAKTAPKRCLLIDDCLVNLEAAQKFGYRVLHFTNIDDLKRAFYQLGFLDSV